MATQENIKKFLPAHLQEVALKYSIPDDMLENNADLVVLVLESKSISDQKEKQSWFDLYSLMNQEQIDKLRDILTREKQKLAEIEARYQAKQEEIKKKYEETYASGAYQQQQDKIRDSERASREQEEVEADALLNQI
jgi:membrane-bound lytic murein transglycosylase B